MPSLHVRKPQVAPGNTDSENVKRAATHATSVFDLDLSEYDNIGRLACDINVVPGQVVTTEVLISPIQGPDH